VTPKTAALVILLSFTLLAQRRIGQSNIAVPVPPDPHELVTGQSLFRPPESAAPTWSSCSERFKIAGS
jgi:hypothetical protein